MGAQCVREPEDDCFESNKEDIVQLATTSAISSECVEGHHTGGGELHSRNIDDTYNGYDVFGYIADSGGVQAGLSSSIETFPKTVDFEIPKADEWDFSVDFSKISTASLEELLKIDSAKLHSIIEKEYVRRMEFEQSDAETSKSIKEFQEEEIRCCYKYVSNSEDLAEKCCCYKPTLVCKIFPAICCRKPAWCKPMTAEDHYLLHTPIEFECIYSKDPPLNHTIVADILFGQEYGRIYYKFVKAHLRKLVVMQFVIATFDVMIRWELERQRFKNFWITCASDIYGSIYLFSFAFYLLLYNWSLLKLILKKFDAIFLMANGMFRIIFGALTYGNGSTSIMFWIAAIPCYFTLFSFDALPQTVMDHRIKLLIMFSWFQGFFIYSVRQSMDSTLEDIFDPDQKYVVHFGGKTWNLYNVDVTCCWNITLFFGRMVWIGFTNPSCYTILRSLVKDKTVKFHKLK